MKPRTFIRAVLADCASAQSNGTGIAGVRPSVNGGLRSLAIACALLIGALLSQAQGGPPGGPPGGGGGWTIEYRLNGNTTVHYTDPPANVDQTTTTPWRPTGSPEWQSSCAIGGITGHIHEGATETISITGSVDVRVSYTGGGTPPTKVWLLVSSNANWTGGSGSCDNGQNDPPVALVGTAPGQVSTGQHLYRIAYSGTPITFTISLSAQDSFSGPGFFSAGAGLNVVTSTRNAVITRNDGGIITEVGNGYAAHTLLSWTGTHGGVDYDSLPDGAPGKTTQTLKGTLTGSWPTDTFVDPTNNQNYTTVSATVAWSGSTTGTQTQTPPTQHSIIETTYLGDMPLFDEGGTAPKTENWKYKVKDKDGVQLELTVYWTAHYANENWAQVGTTETVGNQARSWSKVLMTSADAGTTGTYYFPGVSAQDFTATTTWDVGESPGFTLQKYHIGISQVQSEFGGTKTVHFDPATFPPRVTWAGAPGTYFYLWLNNMDSLHGTVDVWKKTGQKLPTTAAFQPASTALAAEGHYYDPMGD